MHSISGKTANRGMTNINLHLGLVFGLWGRGNGKPGDGKMGVRL